MKTRPDCWDFAMDFLGGPEAEAISEYVTWLETELANKQPVTQENAAC